MIGRGVVCPRPTLPVLEGEKEVGCQVCALLGKQYQQEFEKEGSPYQSMAGFPSLDSHIHCGSIEDDGPLILDFKMPKESEILGGCFFAPVSEVYDRINPRFTDSPNWITKREKVHQYLLDLAQANPGKVYPFYFVWNDFKTEGLEKFRGVKWHRHPDEPTYDYSSEKCQRFLDRVIELQLPIIYEEEKANTIAFIERVGGRTPIIIPHLGLLNGGYQALKRKKIWDKPNVYADCALAISSLPDFLASFPEDRIVLGSDYPFAEPAATKTKVIKLWQNNKITTPQLHNILYNNLHKLLNPKRSELLERGREGHSQV